MTSYPWEVLQICRPIVAGFSRLDTKCTALRDNNNTPVGEGHPGARVTCAQQRVSSVARTSANLPAWDTACRAYSIQCVAALVSFMLLAAPRHEHNSIICVAVGCSTRCPGSGRRDHGMHQGWLRDESVTVFSEPRLCPLRRPD